MDGEAGVSLKIPNVTHQHAKMCKQDQTCTKISCKHGACMSSLPTAMASWLDKTLEALSPNIKTLQAKGSVVVKPLPDPA